MDIFIPGEPRFRNYFVTMARAEVNGLMSTALSVSSSHLKDALTRVRFQDDVRRFAYQQVDTIRRSTDEKQCQQCIQAIKLERDNLLIQDRMLRTGEAVLTASVRFYEENNKVIGYIIDGVGVVLGGMRVIGGVGLILGSISTGNVIGLVAGATLIFHGAGSIREHLGKENFAINSYENAASFLGFDKKLGLLAYQTIDLSTSFYGAFKLTLKPDAWRLFYYTGPDFYRKIATMSKPALAIQGIKSTAKGIQIGNTMYEVSEK